MRFFYYLTNFGDPFLTVPLAAVVMMWIAATQSLRATINWAALFAGGALVVAATKFAYAGWGVEVSALNFAVVSGHTMLATAVYPTTFAICASRTKSHTALWAISAGLAFALAIGVSRVLVGFHSISEVVTGWLLGAVVSGMTCIQMIAARARGQASAKHTRRDPMPFAALALAVVVVCYGKVAPVSFWIDHTAPKLSRWWDDQSDATR